MTLIIPATVIVSEETNNKSNDQTKLQYVTLVWSMSALSQNIPWEYCV